MLIYENEYETKENKNWTKDKIKLQHIHNHVTGQGLFSSLEYNFP